MRWLQRFLRLGPIAAVMVVAFGAYWSQSRLGLFPPDSDPAYYVLGARSLLEGRGLSVAVVWHFLHTSPSMPQPGFELWMPGASIAIAAVQSVLGDSYQSACTAAAAFGAIATALCVSVAHRILQNRCLALACGGLFVLNDRVMLHASSPDSTIFYTVWVLGAMTLVGSALELDGRARAARLAAAGLLAGAAVLTRNDALVTLPLSFVLVGLAWRRHDQPYRLTRRDFGVAGVAFALMLIPWSIRCLHAFGTVWTPASGTTPWLVDYQHLFSYPVHTSASHYLRHVVDHPLETLAAKARASYLLLYWVGDLIGLLVIPLAVVGAVLVLWKGRRFAGTGLALLLSLVVALGWIADRLVAGGSHRSILPLLPFLLSFAVALPLVGLHYVFRGPRKQAGQKVVRWTGIALAAGVWLLVLASTISRLVSPEVSYFEYQQALHFRAAEASLQAAGVPGPVMAIRPAMASYGMGRPSVMAPTGGVDKVCAVAEHFGARSIVLNGYYLDSSGFGQLRGLHRGHVRDARMRPLSVQGNWVVFTLHCQGGS